MFTKIRELQAEKFELQLQELQKTCEQYPDIAEFVRFIMTYANEQAYCGGSRDARLGRALIRHMWEIAGADLSGIGNSVHFDLSWVSELNSFIGNYFLDDAAFTFEQTGMGEAFEFSSATDDGMWLQDPRIIIEAAKANVVYYSEIDNCRVVNRRDLKVDASKVLSLIKSKS